MYRAIGLLGALAATVCGSAIAAAQDTTTTTDRRMVTTPVIVTNGGTMVARPELEATTAVPMPPPADANAAMPTTTTTAPGAAPAAAINTAAAEPAPFRPAPVGTLIETTVDNRLVRTVNGYDVTYDIGTRRDTSRALLTDGFGNGQIYPAGVVESFWPLQVGKSITFNIDAGGPRTVNARVLRTETITVPAGTFYTYVIERRDHGMDGKENIADMWYAPSVGTVVKFQEQAFSRRARPAYEAKAIVLPHVLTGAVPVTTPGDTPDRRAQFCRENGTMMKLPNGQQLAVDCLTYVQAELPAYRNWLQGRPLSEPVSLNAAPPLR